jgi:hypothetical protein
VTREELLNEEGALSFTAGTRDTIVNLQSDQEKLLNGRSGTVQTLDSDSGRYAVRLDANSSTFQVESTLFKPENLVNLEEEEMTPEQRLELLRDHVSGRSFPVWLITDYSPD